MEVSEDAKRILENLPPDGSMIGNMSLRDSLELDPKKYFDAKRELEVAGLIVTGKGKGGSLGRTALETESPALKGGVKPKSTEGMTMQQRNGR